MFDNEDNRIVQFLRKKITSNLICGLMYDIVQEGFLQSALTFFYYCVKLQCNKLGIIGEYSSIILSIYYIIMPRWVFTKF